MAQSEQDQPQEELDVLYEYTKELDQELAEVTNSWNKLPRQIRTSLLSIIRTTLNNNEK